MPLVLFFYKRLFCTKLLCIELFIGKIFEEKYIIYAKKWLAKSFIPQFLKHFQSSKGKELFLNNLILNVYICQVILIKIAILMRLL